MWFPEGPGDANTIDRIPTSATSSNPDITKATIPTSDANVDAIATDPGGDLWFTETGADSVAKLIPPDTFHEYPITGGYTFPGGIAAGPNDSMWFTEDNGGIGEVSASGSITQFPLPSPLGSSGPVPSPNSIAAGTDGNLWFTVNVSVESDGSIVRLTPRSVTYYAVRGPPITGPDLAHIAGSGREHVVHRGRQQRDRRDRDRERWIVTAGQRQPDVDPVRRGHGRGRGYRADGHRQEHRRRLADDRHDHRDRRGDERVCLSHDDRSGETVAADDSCTVDVARRPPPSRATRPIRSR